MPKPKRCPRRHRISQGKFEKTAPPVLPVEKPRNTAYRFREVELIPCEDGRFQFPPVQGYVNLAQSYIPCTIVPV